MCHQYLYGNVLALVKLLEISGQICFQGILAFMSLKTVISFCMSSTFVVHDDKLGFVELLEIHGDVLKILHSGPYVWWLIIVLSRFQMESSLLCVMDHLKATT